MQQEKQYTILPADDAVQNWFEENIDKGCSASSAIYKFIQWLESMQPEHPVSAGWVKASDPNIKIGDYVAKFKPFGINLKHDYLGMAFVGVEYIRFVCPGHYDIKWIKGHEELQYLQLLDETGQSNKEADDPVDIMRWALDNIKTWHNDVDYVTLNSGESLHVEQLYEAYNQQKEGMK